MVIADGGAFHYEERLHYREGFSFPSNMTGELTTGEWTIKESGEWERQGDNLYFHIDDSIIEATIDDGKITIDIDYSKGYIVIPEILSGTWEKVN